MFLDIYELDPAHFLTGPGLAWQAVLKKMVEKDIRRRICHAIHRYAKANNKYIKDYNKLKESTYLQYWDVNNLYNEQWHKSCL